MSRAGRVAPPARRALTVHRRLLHRAFLVTAFVAALCGVVSEARAAAMVTAQPIRPKDFAFLKKDGVYHLFYIRHNDDLPNADTEKDFGHAVSTDLYHWQQLPPVMALDPQGWDNRHVWAPHILYSLGLYWMYYTGVTHRPPQYAETQRIGLAVSTDLMSWYRVGDPVWQTSAAPWAWWKPSEEGVACRDPFVMLDPRTPGTWLMYYTATPANDTSATVVGVARSPFGNPGEWHDLKPLWATYWRNSYNVLTESPHLFQHNGRWFLFMTSNSGQPLTFYTTSDPTGDTGAWTYRGRLARMLGRDTNNWYASEHLRDGLTDLFAWVQDNRIEIRRIVWKTPETFDLDEPSIAQVHSLAFSRTVVREGDSLSLAIRASNAYAFNQRFVARLRWDGEVEREVPSDSLGLRLPTGLTSDAMTVDWRPRRWPANPDTSARMYVRVALEDNSVSTGWLQVGADTRRRGPRHPGADTIDDTPLGQETLEEDDPPPPPPPPQPVDSGAVQPTFAAGGPPAALTIRELQGSPVGRAFVYTLPVDGPVRVVLHDVQGRVVTVLEDGTRTSGVHVRPWDGRADGVPLERGLYFARIVTDHGQAVARVVVTR